MHLKPDHAQQVHDRLSPTLGYLAKLQKRMRELRVDEKDLLFRQMIEAHSAMQGLVVMLHYDSCGRGTIRIAHLVLAGLVML